ncbi:MAG: YebC/PmpR family DNA-binding transcriptional regulator [Pseudomonadota bacterium]|nr:YebC/PmpR family DNA-binding transcriptional regulator [Gammaproteobacteria bacterium]MEC8010534.1 YebC/PmpR family DNA-binding transcriptional regulator [Pseudomonadota bacterium]HBF08960.1 YebC/PmpR family DNA-binding transcriptional regulator [Gammaproteobacteria bacterium]|tara:strand:- start:1722 stop:2468 length:747 start_codon:yes stop_codon:yes gene_type:complete
MAGHSKWANIKHRKAAQDAKRGKIFTRLIREIVISAKLGGGDPSDNPRLRAAIDKALDANMTKDTIERAVKRGAGGDEEGNLDELTYEGYAPGGVAVLVEVMTDNRNRTVAEVRHAFSKHGGNLGTDGSVAYLFGKRGEFMFEEGTTDEDTLMEVALEAGAEDVVANDDGSFEVTCTPEDFTSLREAFQGAGLKWAHGEVTMAPSLKVDLDTDTTVSVLKMLDRLEELDDVQNVYTNANFDDEGLAQV